MFLFFFSGYSFLFNGWVKWGLVWEGGSFFFKKVILIFFNDVFI